MPPFHRGSEDSLRGIKTPRTAQTVTKVIVSPKHGRSRTIDMDDEEVFRTTESDTSQAEAALLALGATLEWERYQHENYIEEEARTPEGRYLIKGHVHYRFFHDEVSCHIYFKTAGHFTLVPSLPTYASYAAAKIACERHHATGIWK